MIKGRSIICTGTREGLEVAPLVRTDFPLGKVDRLPGLGRQADRRHCLVSEVGLIGRHAVKARMRSPSIVEIDVAADRLACIRCALVSAKVDLVLLDRPPKPLDGKHPTNVLDGRWSVSA